MSANHNFTRPFSPTRIQEGCENPPSDSSISRLLRSDRSGGGRTSSHDDDGRKDYSIHGILGGGTRGEQRKTVNESMDREENVWKCGQHVAGTNARLHFLRATALEQTIVQLRVLVCISILSIQT